MMDENRRLAVTLQNLGSLASDAAALAAIPETQSKLDAVRTAAAAALLADAKAKAARALAGREKPIRGRRT